MGFCAVHVRQRGDGVCRTGGSFPCAHRHRHVQRFNSIRVCESGIQTTHIIYIFVCVFFRTMRTAYGFLYANRVKIVHMRFHSIRWCGSEERQSHTSKWCVSFILYMFFFLYILVHTYMWCIYTYMYITLMFAKFKLAMRKVFVACELALRFIYNTSFCVKLFPFLTFRWVCYTHSLLLTLHSVGCAVNRANGFFVYRTRSRARASSCRLVLRFKSAIIWLRFMWIWCRFMGARIARIGFFFFPIAPTYIFI